MKYLSGIIIGYIFRPFVETSFKILKEAYKNSK